MHVQLMNADQTIQQQVERLHGANCQERLEAAVALAALGRKATPAVLDLMRTLSDLDPEGAPHRCPSPGTHRAR